jgi:hypothetical protein
MSQRDIDDLIRRLDQLEQIVSRVSLRPWAPQQPPLQVSPVNGQLVNGVPMIQYAPDPLILPYAYNPYVDVSYIAGIGNGYLSNDRGQQNLKVLVRHNWGGFTSPLLAGDPFQVGGPIAISVSGGGTVLAYPVIGMA